MKRIPLVGKYGKGKFAVVDDEDYDLVSRFRWHMADGYAYVRLPMHRLIKSVERGQIVDHANGVRLDNRRGNLRGCTYTENARNRRKINKQSGYKGVCLTGKPNPLWKAYVYLDSKQLTVGYSNDLHTAALLYDFWATYLHGEFARTNFTVVSQWTAE